MNRSHSKIKHIERANILLEQRTLYRQLTEACQQDPIPKTDSSSFDDSKRYRSEAIKVKDTLVSSGKFKLISQNDGCGNYEQNGNSINESFYYYGPLEILSDPVKILTVDGAYNLDIYLSTGNISCLVAMKCGCGGKVNRILLDPNESSDSMISKINSSGFVKIT